MIDYPNAETAKEALRMAYLDTIAWSIPEIKNLGKIVNDPDNHGVNFGSGRNWQVKGSKIIWHTLEYSKGFSVGRW